MSVMADKGLHSVAKWAPVYCNCLLRCQVELSLFPVCCSGLPMGMLPRNRYSNYPCTAKWKVEGFVFISQWVVNDNTIYWNYGDYSWGICVLYSQWNFSQPISATSVHRGRPMEGRLYVVGKVKWGFFSSLVWLRLLSLLILWKQGDKDRSQYSKQGASIQFYS